MSSAHRQNFAAAGNFPLLGVLTVLPFLGVKRQPQKAGTNRFSLSKASMCALTTEVKERCHLKKGEIASRPVRVIIGAGKICWDFNIYAVFHVRGPESDDLTRVLAAAHFGYWETSFERQGCRYERNASLHNHDAC